MTPVPPPASPCVRVNMKYTQTDGYDGGNRFFIAYAGGAPTAANCATLAGDIATAWQANIAGFIATDWSLTEVDVLDIATETGASGKASVDYAGSSSGTPLPAQCAVNVEYDISRRYRGGKPRVYWPPSVSENTLDPGHWNVATINSFNTGTAAFFAAIAALDIGAMGVLSHVNLSYYQGFKNITNSSGRERAVPQYRAAALVDTVTGYSAKGLIGSQKRRRAATTP